MRVARSERRATTPRDGLWVDRGLHDFPLGLSAQAWPVSVVGAATWALMAGVAVLMLLGLGALRGFL